MEDLDEFLTKLNFVYKNNYINKLKKENKRKQEKLDKYILTFKKEFTEQEIEKREQQQKIEELLEQNKLLESQNKTYKFILAKIPNFIIRLFAGSKKLGGYLNE